MRIEYLYDSKLGGSEVNEIKILAEKKGITAINTSDWDDEKKQNYYYNVLMPISIRFRRKLRGVRSHQAKYIHFDSILVTDNDFYIGNEVLKKLQELYPTR